MNQVLLVYETNVMLCIHAILTDTLYNFSLNTQKIKKVKGEGKKEKIHSNLALLYV